MKIIKITIATLLTMFLYTAATPTVAKTPNGSTPSDEVVCDELKGATPGLYGLCVAYCEATDSPEDLTTEEKIASIPPRSSRVLANYNKRMKDGDPQMPCATYHDETACPAWTVEQIHRVSTDLPLHPVGIFDDIFSDEPDEGSSLRDTIRGFGSNHESRIYASVQVLRSPFFGTLGQYLEYHTVIETEVVVYSDTNSVALTPEEYAACQAEIEANVVDRRGS